MMWHGTLVHRLETEITSDAISQESFEILCPLVIVLIIADLEQMVPEIIHLRMILRHKIFETINDWPR